MWRKKVAESSTLDQAGAWTRDLLVGSQRSNQLRQPRTSHLSALMRQMTIEWELVFPKIFDTFSNVGHVFFVTRKPKGSFAALWLCIHEVCHNLLDVQECVKKYNRKCSRVDKAWLASFLYHPFSWFANSPVFCRIHVYRRNKIINTEIISGTLVNILIQKLLIT